MYNQTKLSILKRYLVYIVTTLVVSTMVISCASSQTTVLEKMRLVLENQNSDPATVYQVLTQDLPTIKDKEVIELLLNYFEAQRRNNRKVYTASLGAVVFYLEQVTGLKSHIDLTIAGPIYYDKSNWDKDIAQWQSWWDVNKDYIAWDDQSKTFIVAPH